MATDDLSSITGLEDKHRRVLAKRQITTLHGLARADRRAIHKAMGNVKPRPTLKQIARWQDEARARLDEARAKPEEARGKPEEARGKPEEARGKPEEARGKPEEARGKPEETMADAAEWHTAASFAVVFAQRQVGGTWERRIEVERTEVEPEQEPEVWPGWECGPICGGMLGQLGQAGPPGQEQACRDGGGQARPAGARPGGQAAGRAAQPAERAQLRVDSAALIDAASEADVVTGGTLVADPPAELTAPVRVVFTVSGARPGTEVQAVAWLRGHGRPGRNAQDPVAVPPSGRAEFDLSQVMAGQLEVALLAWASDATAKPVSVSLPAVMIRPGSD